MDVYDKKCSVKEALSRPSTICSRTWRRSFILDTEVSQTLLSTFWQEWLLMLSTIQNLLSIWSLRWREKQGWSSSHFSKTYLRETMNFRSKTRSKESLCAITRVKKEVTLNRIGVSYFCQTQPQDKKKYKFFIEIFGSSKKLFTFAISTYQSSRYSLSKSYSWNKSPLWKHLSLQQAKHMGYADKMYFEHPYK